MEQNNNSIDCNCLDIVYDEINKTLKNGQYATVDNTEKGDNVYIPVGGFDVNNNNLPYYVNREMANNRNARVSNYILSIREKEANSAKQENQQSQRTMVEDRGE